MALLGLAADSDWILNGPFLFDDTYIHNAYINEISRRIGRWAPRTRFCEVFFNQNGGKLDYADYAGVYVLTEKIKSGKRPARHHRHRARRQRRHRADRRLYFQNRPGRWRRSSAGRFRQLRRSASATLPEPGERPVARARRAGSGLRHRRSSRTTSRTLRSSPFNNTLFTERAAAFSTRNYRNHIDVAVVHRSPHPQLAGVQRGCSAAERVLSSRTATKKSAPGRSGTSTAPLARMTAATPTRRVGTASATFFDRDWWGGLFKDPQFVQEWVDRWWELRQPGQPFANDRAQPARRPDGRAKSATPPARATPPGGRRMRRPAEFISTRSTP